MKTSDLPRLAAVWTPPVQQACYRALLDAFGYPGRRHDLAAIAGDAPAWVAALAAIVDASTTLADPDTCLDDEERRFLHAAEAPSDRAAFVIRDARIPPPQDWRPVLGTLTCPEGGATLLLRCSGLAASGLDQRWRLRGPGIDGTTTLATAGLDPTWLRARDRWCADAPCGVDLVLCDRRQVAVLPRHTLIEAEHG